MLPPNIQIKILKNGNGKQLMEKWALRKDLLSLRKVLRCLGAENSLHGHKVCGPQILSMFVCLQYKVTVEVPDTPICMLLHQDTLWWERDRTIEV